MFGEMFGYMVFGVFLAFSAGYLKAKMKENTSFAYNPDGFPYDVNEKKQENV